MIVADHLIQADTFYDDYISHCRRSAEIVWADDIRRLESRPLELKAFIKGALLSQAYAHRYAEDDIDGPLGHFANEKVLEMYCQIMLFFQDKIPQLKMPTLTPHSPASLIVSTAFVCLLLCLLKFIKTHH